MNIIMKPIHGLLHYSYSIHKSILKRQIKQMHTNPMKSFFRFLITIKFHHNQAYASV